MTVLFREAERLLAKALQISLDGTERAFQFNKRNGFGDVTACCTSTLGFVRYLFASPKLRQLLFRTMLKFRRGTAYMADVVSRIGANGFGGIRNGERVHVKAHL
jgi:hypothetical protein